MTLCGREVIIVHEHHGNSRHIISDNNMRIDIMNHSIASEFKMNINIDIMIEHMQDSFTKVHNIKLKNILEKIKQADFDITLHIKNCGKPNTSASFYPSTLSTSSTKSTTTNIARTTSTSSGKSTTSTIGALECTRISRRTSRRLTSTLTAWTSMGILPRRGMEPHLTSRLTSQVWSGTLCHRHGLP